VKWNHERCANPSLAKKPSVCVACGLVDGEFKIMPPESLEGVLIRAAIYLDKKLMKDFWIL
jgi:hypothetical protein